MPATTARLIAPSSRRRPASPASYVAVVAHVAVGNDGEVTIPRLDMAIDCGLVVNPDRVGAQLEGAAIMTIGNTLYGNITFKEGRTEQSNYTDYLVARTDITPQTHVYFVENHHPPGGVGEPGVPPTGPAICNAIYAANRQTHQGVAGRPTAVESLEPLQPIARIYSHPTEDSLLTNDVDLPIDGGHRQRRPLDGSIGFVGLGHMGSAMAANLAAGGCRVIAYIRRPDRAAEIRDLGLEPKLSIADLFDCDFVVSMLPDDAAVREGVFGKTGEGGLAAGLKPNAVHLSMSTISTAAAGEFAEAHEKHGQWYVAAPVFGNPDAAKARELFIIAAGARDPLDRCRPLFDLLG